MNLRRHVELMWFPVGDDRTVDLPDGARIVLVDFRDAGGLGHRRTPAGVWVELLLRRYDDDHPERGSIYDKARPTPDHLLPPPERDE